MASKRAAIPAKHLFNGFRASQEPSRCFQSSLTRSMATEASLPNATLSKAYAEANLSSSPTQPVSEDERYVPPPTTPSKPTMTVPKPYQPPRNPFLQTAQCTLYDFPSMEPINFVNYPSTHLLLPLRKDILHKAVIYEGDSKRSGTANTKWRSEVHGSGRKIRPQKGTGRARLGDKKSPMLRGGGVAFGPKPRDFSTELPKKIYDLAWRTALSYRYRMGELVITDAEIGCPGVHEDSYKRYMRDVLVWNNMSKARGGTLFVKQKYNEALFTALTYDNMGRHAKARSIHHVDVKALLEGGRVVIERPALEYFFQRHESDLPDNQKLAAWGEVVSIEATRNDEPALA